jgi:hypothetical protein
MEESIMATTRSRPKTRALVPFTSMLAPDIHTLQETVRRLFEERFGPDLFASGLRVFPPAEITETVAEYRRYHLVERAYGSFQRSWLPGVGRRGEGQRRVLRKTHE